MSRFPNLFPRDVALGFTLAAGSSKSWVYSSSFSFFTLAAFASGMISWKLCKNFMKIRELKLYQRGRRAPLYSRFYFKIIFRQILKKLVCIENFMETWGNVTNSLLYLWRTRLNPQTQLLWKPLSNPKNLGFIELLSHLKNRGGEWLLIWIYNRPRLVSKVPAQKIICCKMVRKRAIINVLYPLWKVEISVGNFENQNELHKWKL